MTVFSKKYENHSGILVFDFVIKRSAQPFNPRAGETKELETIDEAESNKDKARDKKLDRP